MLTWTSVLLKCVWSDVGSTRGSGCDESAPPLWGGPAVGKHPNQNVSLSCVDEYFCAFISIQQSLWVCDLENESYAG